MQRRHIVGLIAVGVSALSMLTMGAGSATASANVLGHGTYNCTKVTGSITFKPPLKAAKQTVTETVKATASGCLGGTPKVLSTTASSTSTKTGQSCAGLSSSTPFSVKLSYTNGATASTLAGNAKPSISGSTVTFVITGKTSGSYASLSTVAKGKLKQTTTQLGTACATTGVSVINIISGTITKG